MPYADRPQGDTLDYCSRFIFSVNPYQGPWWEGMNQTLSSYCLSSWCSTLTKITPYTTEYEMPVYPDKKGGMFNSSAVTPYSVISYSSLPSFLSPCCNQCVITIESGARVMYWPTPTPQPPVTSIVDANGFTLYVLLSYVLSDMLSNTFI